MTQLTSVAPAASAASTLATQTGYPQSVRQRTKAALNTEAADAELLAAIPYDMFCIGYIQNFITGFFNCSISTEDTDGAIRARFRRLVMEKKLFPVCRLGKKQTVVYSKLRGLTRDDIPDDLELFVLKMRSGSKPNKELTKRWEDVEKSEVAQAFKRLFSVYAHGKLEHTPLPETSGGVRYCGAKRKKQPLYPATGAQLLEEF